jgi:hypothetical protein
LDVAMQGKAADDQWEPPPDVRTPSPPRSVLDPGGELARATAQLRARSAERAPRITDHHASDPSGRLPIRSPDSLEPLDSLESDSPQPRADSQEDRYNTTPVAHATNRAPYRCAPHRTAPLNGFYNHS